MLYVDQTVKPFWKRLTLIIAVKGSHVEHLNIVYNMNTIQCCDSS